MIVLVKYKKNFLIKNILNVHFYLDLVIFNSIFYNSHSLLSKTPKCNASVTPIGKQIRSNTALGLLIFEENLFARLYQLAQVRLLQHSLVDFCHRQ